MWIARIARGSRDFVREIYTTGLGGRDRDRDCGTIKRDKPIGTGGKSKCRLSEATSRVEVKGSKGDVSFAKQDRCRSGVRTCRKQDGQDNGG